MSEQWKAGFYHHFISRSISMLNKESAAHQVDTLSRLQTNQYGNPSTSQLENWMFEVILVSKSCFRTLWPSSKKQKRIDTIQFLWFDSKIKLYQSAHRLTCITQKIMYAIDDISSLLGIFSIESESTLALDDQFMCISLIRAHLYFTVCWYDSITSALPSHNLNSMR